MNKNFRLSILFFVALMAFAAGTTHADSETHELVVGYRAVSEQQFTETIGAYLWIRNNGDDIDLNELKLTYQFSRDEREYFETNVLYARFRLRSYFTDKTHIQITDDEINIIFDEGAGIFESGDQIDIKFEVSTTNGEKFNQFNDPSFLAHSENFSQANAMITGEKIHKLLLEGATKNESDGVIGNVSVNVNGIDIVTDDQGEFDIWVPEADVVTVRLSQAGYVDMIFTIPGDELISNQANDTDGSDRGRPRPQGRRRTFYLYPADIATVDPDYGPKIVTSGGASITFPRTDTELGPFQVSLTSIATDSASLENYRLSSHHVVKSTFISFGQQNPLEFLGAVDVVIRDPSGNKKVDLEPYGMSVTVKIPVTCAAERLSNVKVFYLDELSDDKGWVEHGSPSSNRLTFIKEPTKCFYQFDTDHFTKYAIAQVNGIDENTLVSDDFSTTNVGRWALPPSKGSVEVKDGKICAQRNSMTGMSWEAQFGRGWIFLEEGQHYRLSFDAKADRPISVITKLGIDAAPWTAHVVDHSTEIGPEMQSYEYTFTNTASHVGSGFGLFLGEQSDVEVCVDNFRLDALDVEVSACPNTTESETSCQEVTNEVVSSATGKITSSGSYASAYAGWKAFDGKPSTRWVSELWESPAYLTYNFDAPIVLTEYSIHFTNGGLTGRAPKNFVMQGSNSNGNAWHTIVTQSNQTNWAGNEKRTYSFPGNTSAFEMYRLLVTEDNDSRSDIVVISIGELTLNGYKIVEGGY